MLTQLIPAAAAAFTAPTAPAATASIFVATPAVAEAATAVVDKPRSSFTSWKQHQGFKMTSPWCRLLTESTQYMQGDIQRKTFTWERPYRTQNRTYCLVPDQEISMFA
ncbi:hypothetical protein PHJA_002193700 [Phtheirospermum japonicum]|uniref:Uncharacterized protein n=1 Tax=Phtheirospermum japonicum TaxID=374723 RepID=A0A830CMD4_9LAMI|nr:hypothetical protein PHJA_002193700 [Phtheirospermum japonicum]